MSEHDFPTFEKSYYVPQSATFEQVQKEDIEKWKKLLMEAHERLIRDAYGLPEAASFNKWAAIPIKATPIEECGIIGVKAFLEEEGGG